MKKNKKTKTERKADLKRGTKRSERLKKTRALKHARKEIELDKRRYMHKKQDEEIMKILESRPQ